MGECKFFFAVFVFVLFTAALLDFLLFLNDKSVSCALKDLPNLDKTFGYLLRK